jgi:adenine-specific DNA methylase
LPQYGIEGFASLFTPRQALTITTLARLVTELPRHRKDNKDSRLGSAVQTLLAFAVDRQVDYLTSLTVWSNTGEFIAHTFGRQALPIVWEWPECQPFADGSGNFDGALCWVRLVIEHTSFQTDSQGQVQIASATEHPLADGMAGAMITDPPYYYSIPYSDLSDFFYVWLKRSLGPQTHVELTSDLTPKALEIVQNLPHSEVAHLQKDRGFCESHMKIALAECMRITAPQSIGVVVFAHSDTDAWESLLNALIQSGWRVTGSWPIDTERASRILAARQSTLASSVHLVCRPRGIVEVGDWRDVLAELPKRMHEWMPRLASEGVVGADAIFACLGPALEILYLISASSSNRS